MRITLFLILGCAVAGLVWACGGATEQSVAEPTPPPVDVEPQDAADTTETDATDGGAAAPAILACARLNQRAGMEINIEKIADAAAEKPADETASAPAPADEKPADSGFVGKGVQKGVLGTMKGKKGPTDFDHWKHQELGVKCFKCHHKGAGRKSCGKGTDCHKFNEVNAPAARTAFHKACNPCHKKKKLAGGCDFCHKPKE